MSSKYMRHIVNDLKYLEIAKFTIAKFGGDGGTWTPVQAFAEPYLATRSRHHIEPILLSEQQN